MDEKSNNLNANNEAATEVSKLSRNGSASKEPAAANTPATEQEDRKKRKVIIIVIVCIAAALLAALLIWFFAFGGSSQYDSNARTGQAPYKTEEEMQEELNRTVEEGMLDISIVSVIDFDDGTSEGIAYIENVPSNIYNMQVTITQDDTGDVLYESGILEPNHYIEKIKLTRDLDAGEYNATATFTALDKDSLNEVGQAAAKVTVNVKA